jgi:cell division control protein 6
MNLDVRKKVLEKEMEYANVKDNLIFDLNAELKPELVYFRPEVEIITDIVIEYLVTGIPQHILVLGWRGSGKTTSVLMVIKTIIKELSSSESMREKNVFLEKYYYVNVRENPTRAGIFEAVLGRSVRGFSFSEVLKDLDDALGGKTVIIFDEVDFIKDNEIFYHVSRSTKALIIAIVQNINWYKSLDSGIQSSFMPRFIFFKNYDAMQLKEILMLRAKHGLFHYDEGAVSLISAIVARDYHGDARIGIRALYHAGKQDKWDEKAIKECIEVAVKEIELHTLSHLSLKDLIILSVLAEQNETNKAYETVSNSLKNFGIYISKPTYYRTLNFLQSLGIITLIKKKAGRYYTYEAQLLTTPELIFNLMNSKFIQ